MKLVATTSIEDGQTPTTKSKGEGWTTFPFIIGGVVGLTLASGGWSNNLIVSLIAVFMNIKSVTATQINNVFFGCNNLFPIAGAIIADPSSAPSLCHNCSRRCFFTDEFQGVTMLALAFTIHSLRPSPCATGSQACETPSQLQYAFLYAALALSSLGLGGTRFTIATMGADQSYKPTNQGTFFSWNFFALYLAGSTSFTTIIYIRDSVSWGLGFGICVISNGLAVFLLGKWFIGTPSRKEVLS